MPLLLLGPGIVCDWFVQLAYIHNGIYLSVRLSARLPVCLSAQPTREFHKEGKPPRQARRVAERRIPPCPHHLTIAILISFCYFRFNP